MGDNQQRTNIINIIDKLFMISENERSEEDLNFLLTNKIPEFRHRRGRVTQKFISRKSQETREYVRKRNILIGTFKSRNMHVRRDEILLNSHMSRINEPAIIQNLKHDAAKSGIIIREKNRRLRTRSTFHKDEHSADKIAAESHVAPVHRLQLPVWLKYCKRLETRRHVTRQYTHLDEWKVFLSLYKGVKLSNSKNTIESKHRPVEQLQSIQVFHPTKEMMEPFIRFVHFMEWIGCDAAGGAKIVPPLDFSPMPDGYQSADVPLFAPVAQKVLDGNNRRVFIPIFSTEHYKQDNKNNETCTIAESFTHLKNTNSIVIRRLNSTEIKKNISIDNITQEFWDSIYFKIPTKFMIRKSECQNFSLFSKDASYPSWKIPEVVKNNVSEVNICSSFTCFPQDNQQFASYSLIYQHAGHSNIIRIIPPSFALKFIDVVNKLEKEEFTRFAFKCPKFMLHQQVIIRDDVLNENSIPYSWIEHEVGSFIVTWPNAFYFGFATGFGIIESGSFYLDGSSMPYALFDVACFNKICPMRDPKSKKRYEERKKWIKDNLPPDLHRSYVANKIRIPKNPLLLPEETVIHDPSPIDNPIPDYSNKIHQATLRDELILRNFYIDEMDMDSHISNANTSKKEDANI